jgi:hypothetical protein
MKYLVYFGWLVLLLVSPLSLRAQDSPNINIDVQTRLKDLRAEPPVERKVQNAENMYRMEMLMREWWDLPTAKEEARLEKGRYSRFQERMLPIDSLMVLPPRGLRYAQTDEIHNEQNLTVMGWHPYWAKDDFKYYNFKLLTHLSYYGYELNPFTGGYRNFEAIHGLENSGVVQEAHLDSCKVLLNVSCFGADYIEAFFSADEEARRNLIDSLITILKRTDADGVDLMFTEVPIEFKWNFIYFVKDLSFALREANNNYTISMTLPLEDPDRIYDLNHLKAWVDFFILPAAEFHIEKTRLVKRPNTPLVHGDAAHRASLFTFTERMTLDSVMRTNSIVSSISLLHDEAYVKALTDTLAVYVAAAKIQAEYNSSNLADLLKMIRLYEPLQRNPFVKMALERTLCEAQYSKSFQPAKPIRFFLFSPNSDTMDMAELDLYGGVVDVQVNRDSTQNDLKSLISRYKQRLGEEHSSSLVLGLPLYGAVWNIRENNEFEGYMSYMQVRELLKKGNMTLRYDKLNTTMIATLYDSLGPVREVFFDNSTSLQRKVRLAMDDNMGGIALWALNYTHGYPEIWSVLEKEFAARRIWNKKGEVYERLKVDKSNKVSFTIEYQLRRNYRLILATVFMISIFLALTFGFSLLDWKVRDVMFYSQAFRLFYLTLFTVLTLILGHWVGILENKVSSLFLGVVLGAALTWLATFLVTKQQEKLP